MLFRVCRNGLLTRWVVLAEGQVYGEYMDKPQAALDAIEAAKDAREIGQESEVWDQEGAKRVLNLKPQAAAPLPFQFHRLPLQILSGA